MKKFIKKIIPNCFLLLIICYLLFLIRPAVLGQLGGTFRTATVPQDYVALNRFLSSSSTFSRGLWVPGWERFGYYSFTHPSVSAINFYKATSLSQLLKEISCPKSENTLKDYSIQYIVVPYDVQGELFQSDRKYDAKQYEATVKTLQSVSWAREIKGFGRNHVFVLDDPKPLFWTSSLAELEFKKIDMTHYVISVKKATKGDKVIFTQLYDPHWYMGFHSEKSISQLYGQSFNSFVLPKSGDYDVDIVYDPQRWVIIGLWIGLITLIGVGICMIIIGAKRYGQSK